MTLLNQLWHVYALHQDRYYDLGDHGSVSRDDAIRTAIEMRRVPDGAKIYAFRKNKEDE